MALTPAPHRTSATSAAFAYMTLLGGTLACVACGSAASPNAFDLLYDSGAGGQDGTLPGDDGGGGSSSGGSSSGSGGSSGGGCAPTCTADLDCQNSCPAVATGSSNCCDLSSGTCFSSSTSSCPSQPDAGAE